MKKKQLIKDFKKHMSNIDFKVISARQYDRMPKSLRFKYLIDSGIVDFIKNNIDKESH